MEGRVAWITIAPVKGLGLVERDSVELTQTGVPENRAFYVIDERGRMFNGKRQGRLVQIRPDYDAAAGTLALHFPDGTAAAGEAVPGDAVDTLFYGELRRGRLVRGPFADALSAYAGRPLRLVTGEGMDRGPGGAVSLLSTAACTTFDARRFRMLFGIGGVPAHAEDGWIDRRVRIGETVVLPTSETGRCLVTSQDPDTGVHDFDMLEWLRANRPEGIGEPLPFGVHGAVLEPGVVRVGDAVSVDPALHRPA